MKVFLVSIAAIFAAVPGLTTIVTELGAPPGRKEIFTAILTFAGCFTLASIFVCRASLRTIPPVRVVQIAAGIAFGSLVLFTFYIALLHEFCSVRGTKPQYRTKDYEALYFPLFLNGEFSNKVANGSSRAAIIDEYGPVKIAEELERMPCVSVSRAFTDIFLLLWYSLVIVGFTLAFAMVGFYEYNV